jgi:LmbE family N-acetylglucosaminyl deacetylase
MKKKILVVGAHPDDEILGCGGTLINHIRNRDTVYSLILGEGITSRSTSRDLSKDKKKLSKIKLHAISANKLIGVKKLYFGNFPDNRFDSVNLLDLIKYIESIFTTIKPDIVYTHFYNDLNIDHRLTFQAVVTACRPYKNKCEIYCFETLSSTDFSPGRNNFNPNYFVDISKSINKKIQALKKYKTEIKKYPFIRSDKNIMTLAQYRGLNVGIKYCEAFELICKFD